VQHDCSPRVVTEKGGGVQNRTRKTKAGEVNSEKREEGRHGSIQSGKLTADRKAGSHPTLCYERIRNIYLGKRDSL